MSHRPAEPDGTDPSSDLPVMSRFSKARLEAFSDGVFAIAITLLVLDLAVEAGARTHLLHALGHLWPSYLAYLTSFLTIGLVWLAHHTIISTVTYIDRTLLRINLALLLVVSFLPFPTRLLAEFIRDPHAEQIAAVFYGSWLLLITACSPACGATSPPIGGCCQTMSRKPRSMASLAGSNQASGST
jgi:uncharacterized membrane protein